MVTMIFSKSILNGKPINIFNYGNMKRDFTYLADIVEVIYKCCYKPAIIDDNLNRNISTSFAPCRIFNIGNSQPIELIRFI